MTRLRDRDQMLETLRDDLVRAEPYCSPTDFRLLRHAVDRFADRPDLYNGMADRDHLRTGIGVWRDMVRAVERQRRPRR